MANVFTDTAGVIAKEGLHPEAVVISTEHVGEKTTKYGQKDFQMFHLQVRQINPDSGKYETAEIHQQYHRSFSPQSSLVKFLEGLGVSVHRGMTLDFDTLVGRKLGIVVNHSKDARGNIHVNITPLKPHARSTR